jgi:hypothetical protein
MKRQWLVLVLAVSVSQFIHGGTEPQKVIALGSFSNIRFTEEHQYGSEIQLWKDDTDLWGLFLHSEGLIGDTPIGLLQNVHYNLQTGDMSFMAKLTTGRHFCKIHKDVPSQDLFNFEGKLSKSSVSGVLKRSDALHPEEPPTEEKVVLKRIAAEESNQILYQSRSEWEAASKEVLKFRGPKW